MKVLKRINVTVLMTFFFLAGPCFGQNTAEEIWTKGVEYAAKGDFNKAKTEFTTALKVDPLFKIADYCGISFSCYILPHSDPSGH